VPICVNGGDTTESEWIHLKVGIQCVLFLVGVENIITFYMPIFIMQKCAPKQWICAGLILHFYFSRIKSKFEQTSLNFFFIMGSPGTLYSVLTSKIVPFNYKIKLN